jgi:predicted nuclease with RNAse H fold
MSFCCSELKAVIAGPEAGMFCSGLGIGEQNLITAKIKMLNKPISTADNPILKMKGSGH